MSLLTPSLLLAIERIERQRWEDMASVITPEITAAIGCQCADVNGAFLFMCSRLPTMQFNRLMGTGLNGDDGRSIDAALPRFRGAGVSKFVIQIPPGVNAAACAQRARDAGLAEHPLAWAKFLRTAAPIAFETSLVIRELEVSDAALFGATAQTGFNMPPAMAQWLTMVVGRPCWHAYMTFDGDTPVGTAALFVSGEIAWLGMGSTLPTARKRGSQSALIAHRINEAYRLGAKYLTTETGIPKYDGVVPSYNNCLKTGFEVAYLRPNWTSDAPETPHR